jgi:hypothetical protein
LIAQGRTGIHFSNFFSVSIRVASNISIMPDSAAKGMNWAA